MQFRRVPGRDSAQVVTPFVQVGTSCDPPVTRGTDYAFISSTSDESPRIAPSVDLPPCGRVRSLTLSGSVVTGPYRRVPAEGFPRHYPLLWPSREGFTVMSGIDVRCHHHTGQFVVYPTRNFATLGILLPPTTSCSRRGDHFCRPPYVAIGFGLYLQPRTIHCGAWRAVSEGSAPNRAAFPADCPHPTDCHHQWWYRGILGVSSI